ncbi:MAG: hypothetical protein ACJA1N_002627 [Saprospiraceae bacterium]|jgi:hypothetical protein
MLDTFETTGILSLNGTICSKSIKSVRFIISSNRKKLELVILQG